MVRAPIPKDEVARLKAVERLHLLDTPFEERFDDITRRAVAELHVPISTISLIDESREWFKSCQGLPNREGDRSTSFCGHSLFAHNLFVVEDTTKDSRFNDNPHVIGPPYIRFYAGMAITDRLTHQPIGVFCIKDIKPRSLSIEEVGAFMALAEEASIELNQARKNT